MSTEYSVTLSKINQDAFATVQRMYNTQEPLIQQGLTDLGAFGTGLNQRLNELQGGKVAVPTKEELHQEEVKKLNTYWDLHATMVKAHELMRSLSAVMTLLNQPARAVEQQSRLDAHYPEVTKTLVGVDTAAKGLFDTLKSHYQHIDSVYAKMSAQMVTTSWEMMKFSDIVANEGQPLSRFRLMYNYIGTPVVRTLTAEELASIPQRSSESQPVESVADSSSSSSSPLSSSMDTSSKAKSLDLPRNVPHSKSASNLNRGKGPKRSQAKLNSGK